jgi:hypothetical protein
MGRFNAIARRRANKLAQQRWRARQRQCRASFRCDVGPRAMSMLVARGYLLDTETGDPHEVSEAVTLFLNDHAEADLA